MKVVSYTIQGTRITNLDKHLGFASSENFFVFLDVTEKTPEFFEQIGFSSTPQEGDTVLPSIKGSISRYNAQGRKKIYRHLPKEPRYLFTRNWKWKQWIGGGDVEEREDFCDIFRDCYPFELLFPPATQFTYRVAGERKIIISEQLINSDDKKDYNKHVINLYLELFKTCTLTIDINNIGSYSYIKYVNWEILPSGNSPWIVKDYLENKIAKLDPSIKTVILDRQETIKSYQPDEQYVGKGGFSDYIAYVFKAHKIVVLESLQSDNALYVFGKEWENFSKLTKAEILNNKLHLDRIIHSKSWKSKLKVILDIPKAA